MGGWTVRHMIVAAAVLVAVELDVSQAHAAGVPVGQATAEQKATATEHFEEGMRLFDEEKFDEALAAFRASYEAVASPNSHLLVGRSLARLDRAADAYNEYTLAIEEAQALGSTYDAAAAAAAREREEVRRRVALLTIERPDVPDLEVTVNGKDVALDRQPIAVAAGEVVVEAHAPDGATSSRRATAEPGGALRVRLPKPSKGDQKEANEQDAREHPAAPAATRTPGQKFRREAAYIAAGIGVGGIATWAVITIAGVETLDDVAVGGLLLGGVGIGAAVVLYLTSEPPSASGAPRSPPARTEIAIGPGPIAVQGSF
jgi:hypothetical protein